MVVLVRLRFEHAAWHAGQPDRCQHSNSAHMQPAGASPSCSLPPAAAGAGAGSACCSSRWVATSHKKSDSPLAVTSRWLLVLPPLLLLVLDGRKAQA